MAELVAADEAVIDAFLEYMVIARGRSARTREVYALALARLREFMAPRSILVADGSELEAFCGLWLHKRGVVARSRGPYVSAVRMFFMWATVKGHVLGNPATEVKRPKHGRPLPRVMSLENAERLMWGPDLSTFTGIRNSAMLGLLLGCGLRVSGLVGLNEGDLVSTQVDGELRMAVRVVEKGDRERLQPLPRETESMLRVYLGHEELGTIDRGTVGRDGRPDRVLFVNTVNSRVPVHEHAGEARRLTRKAVRLMIQGYGQALGIPDDQLHPHAMRHLFGTELTEGDVPTLTTQGLMGHADPKSTAVYTHLAMRKKTQVVDQHAPIGKMRTPVSEFLKRMPR